MGEQQRVCSLYILQYWSMPYGQRFQPVEFHGNYACPTSEVHPNFIGDSWQSIQVTSKHGVAICILRLIRSARHLILLPTDLLWSKGDKSRTLNAGTHCDRRWRLV